MIALAAADFCAHWLADSKSPVGNSANCANIANDMDLPCSPFRAWFLKNSWFKLQVVASYAKLNVDYRKNALESCL
jgi:hypothetical protein